MFASGGGLLAGIEEVPIILLPSSEFTLENKSKWAGSWVDDQQKTYLFVKCVSVQAFV
jgi:sucrose-6-phosphate hydrolase SacC (GH32 family)